MLELDDLYMRHPHVPQRLLFQFSTHAATIASVNAEICRARQMGMQRGQPGRYEWEYRRAHEPRAVRAMDWLAFFESHVLSEGVSAEEIIALYADVGGRPTILPMSIEAAAWEGHHDR